MRVERFSLFFPPLIWRWRPKGSETEYAIGAIPLGGYVKISGMSPEEELPPEVAPRAYLRQKVWKRIVVIAAGPARQHRAGVRDPVGAVRAVDADVHAARRREGRRPTAPRRRAEAGRPDRVVDGARATGRPAPGGRARPRDDADGRDPHAHLRGQAEGRLPRDRAGALRGPARRQAAARGGHAPLHRAAAARGRRPRMPPPSRRRGCSSGCSSAASPSSSGPAGAARYAGKTMWKVTTTTLDSLVKLFYDKQARDQVSGVVGSYEATRQSFEFDTKQAIYVLALISLSLGIINLFPFLPLDGGHIFWADRREAPRPADPVPHHGAGRDRGLHARPVPLLHRAVQRHRAIVQRRRVRCALTRA